MREIYSKWKRGKDDIAEFLEEDITIKMLTTHPIEGRTTDEWYPMEDGTTINEWRLQINKPLKVSEQYKINSVNNNCNYNLVISMLLHVLIYSSAQIIAIV